MIPLPTLLSQLLVAFTIEFDNEFEARMAHPTTPSLVMWSNSMRLVPEEGVPIGELSGLARVTPEGLQPGLACLERHGYLVSQPDPADRRPTPPRDEWVVRPTAAGRRAQAVWRPLFAVIESRWRDRFGPDGVGRVRTSLETLVDQLDVELPEYVQTGLPADVMAPREQGAQPHGAPTGRHLPALLSQALVAFTIDFERDSAVSLATGANALRVLTDVGVRVRDLPGLTGVSKPAVTISVGRLEKQGYAVVRADPSAGRGRVVFLTAEGAAAQRAYRRRLQVVEESWRARYGRDLVDRLGQALQALVDLRQGDQPRLSEGLRPKPGGWRARPPHVTRTTALVRDPGGTLPHYPMVLLHRGGFPDGS